MVIFQAGLISAYIIKTLYIGRYKKMHHSWCTAFIVVVGLFVIIKPCVLKNMARDYHYKQCEGKSFKQGKPVAWPRNVASYYLIT
jgi:hypothetical protein